MKHCSRIATGESLQELISNLERFIKLDYSEKQVLFLKFLAYLHVIVASLIKLLHEVNLQIMNDKKHPETYDRLKGIIVKSLFDCSYREDLCLKSLMPEWEQNVQEEKLRRNIANLFVDLSEKLKSIQKDLDASSSTAKRVDSLSIWGIK